MRRAGFVDADAGCATAVGDRRVPVADAFGHGDGKHFGQGVVEDALSFDGVGVEVGRQGAVDRLHELLDAVCVGHGQLRSLPDRVVPENRGTGWARVGVDGGSGGLGGVGETGRGAAPAGSPGTTSVGSGSAARSASSADGSTMPMRVATTATAVSTPHSHQTEAADACQAAIPITGPTA